MRRLRAIWRRLTWHPGVHAAPRGKRRKFAVMPAVTAIEYQLRPPAETPPTPRSAYLLAADDTTSLPATGGGA